MGKNIGHVYLFMCVLHLCPSTLNLLYELFSSYVVILLKFSLQTIGENLRKLLASVDEILPKLPSDTHKQVMNITYQVYHVHGISYFRCNPNKRMRQIAKRKKKGSLL